MKTLSLLLLISFNLLSQTDTTHYSVVLKGKIAGKQQVWKTGDAYNYLYQFNDRGRGDSILTSIKTTDKGLISSMKINGVSYFKNPYEENFSISGDSAVWMVNGDRKSKRFKNELYMAKGTLSPAIYELFIKWTMKQKDKRTALLPEGFLRMGNPISKTIRFKNKSINLQLIPLYFDPNPLPTYIWLTENMQFFAIADNWMATIRLGEEGLIDSLLHIQEVTDQPYFEAEVKNNSRQVTGLSVFTNATVFYSTEAVAKKNMTVEVVGGKIKAIYPSLSQHKYTKADTVIDCKGKFLMPGLWDMHSHYFKESGLFYVAGGVTHVRDMGNEKIILAYKKRIAENKLLGPDISYLSLLLDKAGQLQAPTGEIISTLDEGFKAIDSYKGLGFQQLKIYSSIDPEWVEPLIKHAHQLKMRVSGHIPMGLTAQQGIHKGYDELTHLNFVFLNFLDGYIGDIKGMARFTAIGEKAGNVDLQSEKVQHFLSLMKQKHTVLDPTLGIMQRLFEEFKGDTTNYLKPVVKWMPEAMASSVVNQSPLGNDSNKVAFKACFLNMLKMVKLIHAQGISLVAGTDGGDANALHHELELYVQAGISANEVLKIATYNAALNCNLQNEYGQIKIGFPADFILIDGDPLQNISDIRKIEFVVKNQRLYQPKQLLSKRGWTYYY